MTIAEQTAVLASILRDRIITLTSQVDALADDVAAWPTTPPTTAQVQVVLAAYEALSITPVTLTDALSAVRRYAL